MSNPLVKLTKHDLAVADFASTDDSRPILTGVLVRVKDDYGVELVATDSYRLIVHKVGKTETADLPEGNQLLIPADVFKRAHRYYGAVTKKHPKTVELYNDHLAIPELGVRIDFTQIEGKYPDVDSLLKRTTGETPARVVSLDPKLVGKTMAFFATEHSVKINFNGNLSPVEIKSDNSHAVVMPQKS